ncbi:MAG: GNAT family N-acetyltransferase [Clostridia bacterium]|nr:GNAT family N-acetyltransferase [Clostridia bacterium]
MNAAIDISGTVLRTERTLLRPWRDSDLEDLFAYASVDGVGQAAGWRPHPDREESRRILTRFIARKRTFALEVGGRAVGSVGIEEYDEKRFPAFDGKRCRQLGFVLAKECWGRGLMPEAVCEVLRYLFEDVGLDAVFCAHFLSNKRSARVQEKCGFRHLAFGRYETAFGTVEEDETTLLTREDWLRSRGEAGGGNT